VKHPLDGVRVVDLAGYIAGAYCAGLLADMGARVVKVESPAGDGFRSIGGAFQGWNRGKRAIVLDLLTDEGREILYQMVAAADVVTENYRPGVARKLGVDYDTLKAVNPTIIYCTATGYGTDGPYADKPTFDPLLQAQSGAVVAQGGEGNTPNFLRMAVSDYAGAIIAASGVAAALVNRARTGRGQRLETALLNSAIAVQAGEFFSYPGKRPAPRLESLGLTSTYRLYKAQDGWFFLSCTDDTSWSSLCHVTGRLDLAREYPDQAARQAHDTEIGATLDKIFVARPRRHWLALLQEAGVKCASSSYMKDIHDDPQAQHLGLTVDAESPDAGPIKQMGLPVTFSRTPGKIWGPSPAHGQHTDEILAEMGFSAKDIAGLRERGVAR
jgi:crotonobetainyl-CoA:carnitine CoA-transferase CaiB-like acyl-CoA transferase